MERSVQDVKNIIDYKDKRIVIGEQIGQFRTCWEFCWEWLEQKKFPNRDVSPYYYLE